MSAHGTWPCCGAEIPRHYVAIHACGPSPLRLLASRIAREAAERAAAEPEELEQPHHELEPEPVVHRDVKPENPAEPAPAPQLGLFT